MLDDAANLPKDFLDSALTTTSLLIAGSTEGVGDFDGSEYVDDLRQTMNELVVGSLLQNIPGEPGRSFNSGGLEVKSSKQTADNIDKDSCGGGVFDFPAGMIGVSAVNCGYMKQPDGSYEEATGEKMASEVSNLEKEAKSRNETCSNLSLYTRLTRVKRLSRKRCCDTTPGRCQEGSRFTILFLIS